MGITKTTLFDDHQNILALQFKALGHPARVAIIQYLLDKQVCICGSLVEELGLSQATISQHLKVLREANLIQGSISGTAVCYCVNPLEFNKIRQFIAAIANVTNLSCCD